MTATLAQVAAHAGVSTATVSRVLNENYPVAEPTRARVLAAVEELDYVVNAHARALMTASSGLMGVVLHDVSDPFFSEIAKGVQGVAERNSCLVVICNSLRDSDRELAYIETLRRQRADVIVLAGGAIESDDYQQRLTAQARGIASQGSRLVLCGRERQDTDSVNAQHRAGAKELTRHLLDAGHRRIAFIAGPEGLSTSRQRFDGFRAALSAHGLEPLPELLAPGDFSRDRGYAAALELVDRGRPFTALFAANDLMAVGALSALRERGVAVPGEVSVVGFDDIPIARDVTPPLTTVRVPLVDMGRRAVELALTRSSRDAQPGRIRLPTELVVRGSVSRPPR